MQKVKPTELIVNGDENQIIAIAMDILKESVLSVKNPAIGFDIDETLIFWDPNDDESIIIRPIVKELFDYAKNIGVAIFIITARLKTKNNLLFLLDQLKTCGFDLSAIPQHGIYLTPKSYIDDKNPARFKYEARKHISEKFNVHFVMMVGDKFWDIFKDDQNLDEIVSKSRLKQTDLFFKPDDITDFGIRLAEGTIHPNNMNKNGFRTNFGEDRTFSLEIQESAKIMDSLL